MVTPEGWAIRIGPSLAAQRRCGSVPGMREAIARQIAPVIGVAPGLGEHDKAVLGTPDAD